MCLGGGLFLNTVVVAFITLIKPFQASRTAILRDMCFYLTALGFTVFMLLFDHVLYVWQPIGTQVGLGHRKQISFSVSRHLRCLRGHRDHGEDASDGQSGGCSRERASQSGRLCATGGWRQLVSRFDILFT